MKKFLRILLLSILSAGLILAIFIGICLMPRHHPTDHLSLGNGRTTVANLTCPAENFQWRGDFRLAGDSPIPPQGPSQIVMRLKNQGSVSLQMNPVLGPGGITLEPGETKEIFRGKLDDLLNGGALQMFSLNREDARVELQIDSTLSQEKPVELDIRWFYTHYSF